MANVILADNIHKTYKISSTKQFKAVDGLSFNVEEASCFGFLGPNGAGKTTMMKMIYGRLDRDSSTECRMNIFGFDPAKNPLHVRYASGVVPQDDSLDDEINVYKNLIVYSKFFGIPEKEAGKRIYELLDFMELTEKSKVRPRALSGGMKRRLVIARALLHKPRLLILDEPTTGLDPQVRHAIWKKLRELKENGITILLTTHYMDEAFQVCDNIIIMNKGKKVIEGNPIKLVNDNLEKYVLELVKINKEILTNLKINKSIVRADEQQDPPRFYSDNLDALKNIADNLSDGEHFLRQSNLEDLFMKLTGRSLNEYQ
jgi:lipooligosaccharide transport system ATP-binding protein